MNEEVFRAIAGALARIEGRLERIETELAAHNSAASAYTDLEHALRAYFGTKAVFTASGACMAADQDGALFDAVSVHVDLDAPNPAIHMGRVLARCPNVERVGDKRGAGLFKLRG